LLKIFFCGFLYQPFIGLTFLKSVLSFDPDFVPNHIHTNYLTAKNNDVLIRVPLCADLCASISLPFMAE
jgi:hypothetical protein